MPLTTADLARLELKVRGRALDLRKECPEGALIDPANDATVRAGYKIFLQAADDYQMIADLLLGMQGNWGKVAPLVRAGYNKMTEAAPAPSVEKDAVA